MNPDAYKLIPDDFPRLPSLAADAPVIDWVDAFAGVEAVAVLVGSDGEVPAELGLDREALARAGFTGASGGTLVVPTGEGPLLVAVGAGALADLDQHALRDAAARATRATKSKARFGLRIPETELDAETLGRVVAEGVLLARYAYTPLKNGGEFTELELVQVLADGTDPVQAADGTGIGRINARAANISRDLCNAPPSHLTAVALAEVAGELGERFGFQVQEFGREELIALRCGGLLGVNAGSAQEPRMLKLHYAPAGEPTGHLGLVGKGIMYDSGGVSLKPSDPMHLLMKMDMGGAASVLATFTALRDLGASAEVTGFLMCTDNMPDGAAYKLGDVLSTRSGLTIEVKNTDAEGRLVMCDALTLAVEDGVDAVVDIATLTGAALMALGQLTAALLGNDQELVDAVRASAADTDEQVWQLPLERAYRKQLDSDIADISNLGGKYAGATTAALFLAEFVGQTPWAHLDIAGTMQSDTDDVWRSKGATGFGARTLIDLAQNFSRG
ncbi:leucyl aminopeptidase family protein [Paeniglutamicibacter sp. R2-26]|uniref:leucyl aminopeptidase family protein n=1 Tax=Paeniglutamicibacter sp. R2-26 TaxID=3144417 RepID=UPI003EE7F533